MATLAMGAVALWLLGDEASAVRESNRAIEIARRTLQPSSTAMALHFAAMLQGEVFITPFLKTWITTGLVTIAGLT